jgi:hypothetical protein
MRVVISKKRGVFLVEITKIVGALKEAKPIYTEALTKLKESINIYAQETKVARDKIRASIGQAKMEERL